MPDLEEDGGLQPLCAVYEPECAEALVQQWQRGLVTPLRRLARDWPNAVAVVPKPFRPAFANINTPEELHALAPDEAK
jgi:molybdopterin-guanine dinucleotide biosynthesis protein A